MNKINLIGYTSYSKVQNFQGGRFSHRFSITLQAGKDSQTGEYRKEYIDVRLTSDLSAQINYPGDGTKIEILNGRLRCEPWIDRNQQKRKAIYIEVFEARVLEFPNPQFHNHQAPTQAPNYQNHSNHNGQTYQVNPQVASSNNQRQDPRFHETGSYQQQPYQAPSQQVSHQPTHGQSFQNQHSYQPPSQYQQPGQNNYQQNQAPQPNEAPEQDKIYRPENSYSTYPNQG